MYVVEWLVRYIMVPGVLFSLLGSYAGFCAVMSLPRRYPALRRLDKRLLVLLAIANVGLVVLMILIALRVHFELYTLPQIDPALYMQNRQRRWGGLAFMAAVACVLFVFNVCQAVSIIWTPGMEIHRHRKKM